MAPQTLSFRAAEAADVPALHRLVECAYRGDSARAGWTHEADLLVTPRSSVAGLTDAVSGGDDQVVLLAFAGDELVGCVQVSRVGEWLGYFGLLTVDPTRQAGGLGRAIIAAAEAWARDRWDATVVQLSVVSVRAELIAWYQRRGYRLTGETRPFPEAVEPPLTLAVMEKPL